MTAALLLTLVTYAGPQAAQTSDPRTPAEMYARAQEKEQVARSADPVVVSGLRSAATSYEIFFRQYPASGYTDNALWQAANLWKDAFLRSKNADDAKRATRWFEWLRDEYAASPLARQVQAQLSALITPPAETRVAAAPPPPLPLGQSIVVPKTPAAVSPTGRAAIRSITTAPLSQGQRISIELSEQTSFRTERVNGPERVYFDFANTTVPGNVIEGASALPGNVIKGVRFGHPAPGVTRVVLDLNGAPKFTTSSSSQPFTLNIDVTDSSLPQASRASVVPSSPAVSTPPASVTSRGDYSLSRQLGLGVSRIVIDAGHGGHDPGASGNGVTEAELVLDVAKRVEKLLEARGGFDVVLTRSSDDFIPLEERTAIANREVADLFLSIHANASTDETARGVETYFLSFATNTQAEAVAARENALGARNMGALPQLAKAITLNDKVQESRELATFVQGSMVNGMSQQNRALRDLGVKQAPFVVLIGARMPSVLAEISFLTNKNEASLLKQTTFRQRIAQALCDSIVRYQLSLKKVSAVTSRDGGR